MNQVAPDALPPVTEALEVTLRAVWARDVGGSTGFGMLDRAGRGAFARWYDDLVDPDGRRVTGVLDRELAGYGDPLPGVTCCACSAPTR